MKKRKARISSFCPFPLSPQNECFLSQTERKCLQSQVFLSQPDSSEDCRYPERRRKEELPSLCYFVTKLSMNSQECFLAEPLLSGISHSSLFQFCNFAQFLLLLTFASNLYPPPLSISLPLFFHLAAALPLS